MKPKMIIRATLGLVLAVFGLVLLINRNFMFGPIPFLIGVTLVYSAFHRSRVTGIIFGHVAVVVGCYLVTWGLYLLPYSEPSIAHVFGRPLFWGLFSIFGGICALFHGFCNCVVRRADL